MLGFFRRAALSMNIDNGLFFLSLSFSEQWNLAVKMLCLSPKRAFCAHGKGNIAAADGEKLHLRHRLSPPLENHSCNLHRHDFQHSAAGHQKEPDLPCPLRFGDGRGNSGNDNNQCTDAADGGR